MDRVDAMTHLLLLLVGHAALRHDLCKTHIQRPSTDNHRVRRAAAMFYGGD